MRDTFLVLSDMCTYVMYDEHLSEQQRWRVLWHVYHMYMSISLSLYIYIYIYIYMIISYHGRHRVSTLATHFELSHAILLLPIYTSNTLPFNISIYLSLSLSLYIYIDMYHWHLGLTHLFINQLYLCWMCAQHCRDTCTATLSSRYLVTSRSFLRIMARSAIIRVDRLEWLCLCIFIGLFGCPLFRSPLIISLYVII